MISHKDTKTRRGDGMVGGSRGDAETRRGDGRAEFQRGFLAAMELLEKRLSSGGANQAVVARVLREYRTTRDVTVRLAMGRVLEG